MLAQTLPEGLQEGHASRVLSADQREPADPGYPRRLLPPEWQRPAATHQREPAESQAAPQELASSRSAHRMTSVACWRTACGMVRPRAWAVFRLTMKSNMVGCSIGISPAGVPFRILST